MGMGLAGKGTVSGTGFEVGSRPGWTQEVTAARPLPQVWVGGGWPCFRACVPTRLPASRSRADFSGLMERDLAFCCFRGLRLSATTKPLLLKLG